MDYRRLEGLHREQREDHGREDDFSDGLEELCVLKPSKADNNMQKGLSSI